MAQLVSVSCRILIVRFSVQILLETRNFFWLDNSVLNKIEIHFKNPHMIYLFLLWISGCKTSWWNVQARFTCTCCCEVYWRRQKFQKATHQIKLCSYYFWLYISSLQCYGWHGIKILTFFCMFFFFNLKIYLL